MKKEKTVFFLILLLAILCTVTCAAESERTYVAAHVDQSWVCRTFDSRMNDEARAVFASLLQEGDSVTCGVQVDIYGKTSRQTRLGCWMLMGVRRGEENLLLAARDEHAYIAARNFLPADIYVIEEVVRYEADGDVFHVSPGIRWADRTLKLIPATDGAYMDLFTCAIDGGTMSLDWNNPQEYTQMTLTRGEDVQVEVLKCEFPLDVGAWTMQSIPATAQQMQAWASAHPIEQ